MGDLGNIIPYSGSVPPHPYSPYCNCLSCVTISQQQLWAQQQNSQIFPPHLVNIHFPCIPSLPPIESAPPIISDLITYRCWNINRHGLLTSVYMSSIVWIPHESLEAATMNDNAQEGIHSFKSLSDAYSYPAEVVGSIQIWGEVIEHEKGYRSQFAKIHSILSVAKDANFRIRDWSMNRKLLKHLQNTYLNLGPLNA